MKMLALILLLFAALPVHGEAIVLNQAQPALDEQANPTSGPVILYHPALPGMARFISGGQLSERLYHDAEGNWYERFEFRPMQGTPRQLLQKIVKARDGSFQGQYRQLAPETRRELKAAAPLWAFSK